MLDEKYVVEIQTILRQDMLCVFDFSGKCIHSEKSHVAYSATFGPDIDDIANWKERATTIVNDLTKGILQSNPRQLKPE